MFIEKVSIVKLHVPNVWKIERIDKDKQQIWQYPPNV